MALSLQLQHQPSQTNAPKAKLTKQQLAKPLSGWLPPEYNAWAPAKQAAWNNLREDPAPFYYWYAPPGHIELTSAWSGEEISRLQFLAETRISPDELLTPSSFAYLSMLLPGRTGQHIQLQYKLLHSERKVAPIPAILTKFSPTSKHKAAPSASIMQDQQDERSTVIEKNKKEIQKNNNEKNDEKMSGINSNLQSSLSSSSQVSIPVPNHSAKELVSTQAKVSQQAQTLAKKVASTAIPSRNALGTQNRPKLSITAPSTKKATTTIAPTVAGNDKTIQPAIALPVNQNQLKEDEEMKDIITQPTSLHQLTIPTKKSTTLSPEKRSISPKETQKTLTTSKTTHILNTTPISTVKSIDIDTNNMLDEQITSFKETMDHISTTTTTSIPSPTVLTSSNKPSTSSTTPQTKSKRSQTTITTTMTDIIDNDDDLFDEVNQNDENCKQSKQSHHKNETKATTMTTITSSSLLSTKDSVKKTVKKQHTGGFQPYTDVDADENDVSTTQLSKYHPEYRHKERQIQQKLNKAHQEKINENFVPIFIPKISKNSKFDQNLNKNDKNSDYYRLKDTLTTESFSTSHFDLESRLDSQMYSEEVGNLLLVSGQDDSISQYNQFKSAHLSANIDLFSELFKSGSSSLQNIEKIQKKGDDKNNKKNAEKLISSSSSSMMMSLINNDDTHIKRTFTQAFDYLLGESNRFDMGKMVVGPNDVDFFGLLGNGGLSAEKKRLFIQNNDNDLKSQELVSLFSAENDPNYQNLENIDEEDEEEEIDEKNEKIEENDDENDERMTKDEQISLYSKDYSTYLSTIPIEAPINPYSKRQRLSSPSSHSQQKQQQQQQQITLTSSLPSQHTVPVQPNPYSQAVLQASLSNIFSTVKQPQQTPNQRFSHHHQTSSSFSSSYPPIILNPYQYKSQTTLSTSMRVGAVSNLQATLSSIGHNHIYQQALITQRLLQGKQ